MSNAAYSCQIQYHAEYNGLYFIDSQAPALVVPGAPGQPINGVHCKLDASASSALLNPGSATAGVTLNLALALQPSALGVQNVYAQVYDSAGNYNSTSYNSLATWSVYPERTTSPPTVSMAQTPTSATSQVLHYKLSDGNGYTYIVHGGALLSSVGYGDPTPSCYFLLAPPNILFVEYALNGIKTFAGAGTIGTGGVVGSPGQCWVDLNNSKIHVNPDPSMPDPDPNSGLYPKTVAGVATYYVYGPDGQLAMEVGGGAPPAGTTGTVWLTTDHLGSTRLVTKAGGTCVGAHDYLPFGEEVPVGWGRSGVGCYGVVDTGVKFTGKERDAESGLDYFGARYMSAAQGRFTSVDPAMASAVLDDPQSWNRYSYVSNRPLAYTDPNGLIPVPVIAGAIGAGTSAVGSAATQYYSTGHVDWGKVRVAAGGGFIAGATFGPIGGLVSKVATSPWVTSAVAGAASNILGGIATRAGNAAADGTDRWEVVGADALESDAAYGVAGGVLGEAAGRFWRGCSELCVNTVLQKGRR